MSFLEGFKNKVKNEAKEQFGIIKDRAFNGNETSSSNGGPQPNLTFPSDVDIFKRPYIRFGCHSADTTKLLKHICLPCPPGIQFTDGAEYSTISMGKIAAIADMTRAGVEGFESGGALGAVGGTLGNARDQALSGGAGGAAILAARALGADSIAQGLEFSSKKTINPRMNTAFTGNTLRTFEFAFKLIGSSKKEVNMIKEIQQYFQEQVYAEELGGQKVMLKYPSQWTIQFMDPGGNELTHIPKIYKSYLTSCSTQVNATGATFRKDMSPIEVDVSLSFQETKILTRNELASLNNNGNRENKDTGEMQRLKGDLGKTISDLIDRDLTDKGLPTWTGTHDAVLARRAADIHRDAFKLAKTVSN